MRGTVTVALGSLVAVAVLGFGAGQAEAITYTGSGINPASGNFLSASADFANVGGKLQITLTNTGGQATVPSDVLTGIFFTLNGIGPLTPVSAKLAGSSVFYGPNGGGNVGGEWAYKGSLAGPHGATSGISTAGLGLFGNANFVGPNLTGSNAVQGLNYGIVSAADNIHAGNASVTGGNPLIQNHVVFTLSGGLPGTLYAANFTKVSFQYGTALNEPNIQGQCTSRTGCTPPVPEPSTVLLLGSGLVGLAAWKRRKAS